ncbi:MAG: helix-turn-helix domain-containing protein [Candidatus Helarchaeota archaeon]|nr:helix-turn-helix domain-containing protein [Candidatus Helarchaeota archaeon]
MSTPEKSLREPQIANEEEIFKSLNHKIRRDIIKIVGEKELTFTEIKNGLESIDSPTLSYHLKSMQQLFIQKDNKYKLSEIGEAAFILLTKTDQSIKISKYKKNFLYAYLITVACWVCAYFFVPLIVNSDLGIWISPTIQIVITAISWVNFVIIWQLRKKYY